jgi:hypothetical protein
MSWTTVVSEGAFALVEALLHKSVHCCLRYPLGNKLNAWFELSEFSFEFSLLFFIGDTFRTERDRVVWFKVIASYMNVQV